MHNLVFSLKENVYYSCCMNAIKRKLASKFKPKITIKVIADNAYREQSSALELDRIILFDQEIENEIPRIACGMSITNFEASTRVQINKKNVIWEYEFLKCQSCFYFSVFSMKFRCTENKSRETGEKCLVPSGKLVSRCFNRNIKQKFDLKWSSFVTLVIRTN